jgi:hypothetical protein
MKGLLKHRPSPSLVIAVIALVMATVGTAIAATNLAKNSVGSKQLKKNAVVTNKIKKEAVTGAKVKKNTLTGKNINLSTLGTVPSATSATTATTAQGLTPLEPVHRVGAPGEPGFEGEATNFGPFIGAIPTQSVGFYKDHEGIVHLVGLAKAGNSGALFRLPAGFRPANGLLEFFAGIKGENKTVIVAGSGVGPGGSAGGALDAFGAVKGEPVTLSGITFRAES